VSVRHYKRKTEYIGYSVNMINDQWSSQSKGERMDTVFCTSCFQCKTASEMDQETGRQRLPTLFLFLG